MNSSVLFAVFLLLLVDPSLQYAKLVNCPEKWTPPEHVRNTCAEYTCYGGGKMIAKGCKIQFCKSPKAYYPGDPTQMFPNCCTGPIC